MNYKSDSWTWMHFIILDDGFVVVDPLASESFCRCWWKMNWDSIIWWIQADGHFSFQFPYKQNSKCFFSTFLSFILGEWNKKKFQLFSDLKLRIVCQRCQVFVWASKKEKKSMPWKLNKIPCNALMSITCFLWTKDDLNRFKNQLYLSSQTTTRLIQLINGKYIAL